MKIIVHTPLEYSKSCPTCIPRDCAEALTKAGFIIREALMWEVIELIIRVNENELLITAGGEPGYAPTLAIPLSILTPKVREQLIESCVGDS